MQCPASSSSAGPTRTLDGVPVRFRSCFSKIRHRALPHYFNRLVMFSHSLFPFSIKEVLPRSQPLDAHLDTIMRKPRLRGSASVGPDMMTRALPYVARVGRSTCPIKVHEGSSFVNRIKHLSKTFVNLTTTAGRIGKLDSLPSQAVQAQSKTKCQLEMEEQTDLYYEDDDVYEITRDSFILFGGRCFSVELLQVKRTDSAKSYDTMFSTMYERPPTTSGSVYDHGQPMNKVTKDISK